MANNGKVYYKFEGSTDLNTTQVDTSSVSSVLQSLCTILNIHDPQFSFLIHDATIGEDVYTPSSQLSPAGPPPTSSKGVIQVKIITAAPPQQGPSAENWDKFEQRIKSLLMSEQEATQANTMEDGAMYSSWTHVSLREFETRENIDLGRLLPFCGRDAEVTQLGELLHQFKRWWQNNANGSSDAHKLDGFAFYALGAASGIGKSTFARMAFESLYSMWKDDSQIPRDPELYQLLENCVAAQRLFRVTYVDGLKNWERKSPDISIALRVLYQFCKRRLNNNQKLSFEEFVELSKMNNSVTLARVLEFTTSCGARPYSHNHMFVIHIDETNHLAAAGEREYLVAVMNSLYNVMNSPKYFVPCLFSGTNAQFLMSLKRTSQFRVTPIHLCPLKLQTMKSILEDVAGEITQKNGPPLESALVRLVAEASGNPQILKFQIHEMGEIGKGRNDFGDANMPVTLEQVPDVAVALRQPDRPLAPPSRNITDFSKQGFCEFFQSQSIEIIQSLRRKLRQKLITSHILSSVDALRSSRQLMNRLFGYALSGETVHRGTQLEAGWTVGGAEMAGFIYLDSVGSTVGEKRPLEMDDNDDLQFIVIIPLIMYPHFTSSVVPGDLLDIAFLRQGWDGMSSRQAEQLDMAALAFFVEWYFEKNSQATEFNIREVFPNIPGLPSVLLQKPNNFRKASIRFEAAKAEGFQKVADDYSNVATFTLGSGNDSFPDAWAYFKQKTGESFTIFIQSKKTITEKVFRQADLEQQLNYLPRIKHWFLFIITDGVFEVEIHESLKEKVFLFDKNTQHQFYGPVLTTIRNTIIETESLMGLQTFKV